jgi:Ni/Co efflux regulator RcnB
MKSLLLSTLAMAVLLCGMFSQAEAKQVRGYWRSHPHNHYVSSYRRSKQHRHHRSAHNHHWR